MAVVLQQRVAGCSCLPSPGAEPPWGSGGQSTCSRRSQSCGWWSSAATWGPAVTSWGVGWQAQQAGQGPGSTLVSSARGLSGPSQEGLQDRPCEDLRTLSCLCQFMRSLCCEQRIGLGTESALCQEPAAGTKQPQVTCRVWVLLLSRTAHTPVPEGKASTGQEADCPAGECGPTGSP